MKDLILSFVSLVLTAIILPYVFKQLELTEVKIKSEN